MNTDVEKSNEKRNQNVGCVILLMVPVLCTLAYVIGRHDGRHGEREIAELVGTGGFTDDGAFFWNADWSEYEGPLICWRDSYMVFKERILCKDDGMQLWQVGKVSGHQKWSLEQ